MAEAVVGMAHRGRLNVLANVSGKRLAAIFAEFSGVSSNPEEAGGSGWPHCGAPRPARVPPVGAPPPSYSARASTSGGAVRWSERGAAAAVPGAYLGAVTIDLFDARSPLPLFGCCHVKLQRGSALGAKHSAAARECDSTQHCRCTV